MVPGFFWVLDFLKWVFWYFGGKFRWSRTEFGDFEGFDYWVFLGFWYFVALIIFQLRGSEILEKVWIFSVFIFSQIRLVLSFFCLFCCGGDGGDWAWRGWGLFLYGQWSKLRYWCCFLLHCKGFLLMFYIDPFVVWSIQFWLPFEHLCLDVFFIMGYTCKLELKS